MKKILSVLLVSIILNNNVSAGTHALERASNALNEAMKIGADVFGKPVNAISDAFNNFMHPPRGEVTSVTPSSSVVIKSPSP